MGFGARTCSKAGRSISACALVLALTACHAPTKKLAFGAVDLNVLMEASNALPVDTVSVAITSNTEEFAEIDAQLYQGSAGWTTLIDNIPAGSVNISISANYMGGPALYSGATDAIIAVNETTTVIVNLEATSGGGSTTSTVPTIDSITASSAAVSPGDLVTLTVVATPGDMGDTLTYAWSDGNSASDFTSTTSAMTTWVAPVTEGTYTISITVSNAQMAQATATFAIDDHFVNGAGSANVQIFFDVWPQVTGLYATPSQIAASGMTNLSLTVDNPQNNTLTYSWSDGGCGDGSGSFSDNDDMTAQNPVYTAPPVAPMTGTCTLTVNITDGLGGTGTGDTVVNVGPPPTPIVGPVITGAYQDVMAGTFGQIVHFSVSDYDPQGQTLSYSWGVTRGLVVINEFDTQGTSGVEAQLQGEEDAGYSITVGVMNTSGITTLYTFLLAYGGPSIDGFSVTAPGPLAVGQSLQLTAFALMSDSSRVNITSFAIWESDNMSAATVTSPGGVVTGVTSSQSAIVSALVDFDSSFPYGYIFLSPTPGYSTVSSGYSTGCAVRLDGTLWCWGDDSCGQGGDGNFDSSCQQSASSDNTDLFTTPTQETSVGGTWAGVSVGTLLACGVNANQIYCWGTPEPGTQPTTTSGNGLTITQATNNMEQPGDQITFTATGGSGTGYTWTIYPGPSAPSGGSITSGGIYTAGGTTDVFDTVEVTDSALNTATATVQVFNPNPHPVGAPTTPWEIISVGSDDDACALSTGGAVYCWGPNYSGEVGVGTTNPVAQPTLLTGTWADISVGQTHTCGVDTNGAAWCWGGPNNHGELGTGGTLPSTTPVQVMDCSGPLTMDGTCDGGSLFASTNWQSISAGYDHTCGVRTTDGTLWCWGGDDNGQLGISQDMGIDIYYPVQVGAATNWVSVVTGSDDSCAINTNHEQWCFGYDYDGELGDGQFNWNDKPSPIQTIGGAVWASGTEGWENGCGIQTDNTLWCWGYDGDNQLGDGDAAHFDDAITYPQQVADMTPAGSWLIVDLDAPDGLPDTVTLSQGNDTMTFTEDAMGDQTDIGPASQMFATPIPAAGSYTINIVSDLSGECSIIQNQSGTAGAAGGAIVAILDCGGE